MKITSLTSCCVDFFPEQDKIYVGGNSLNFATQCKISGISNVSVIGAVGDDRFGQLIEAHLDKLKINRSHLYRIDAPTASNKIYINPEGDRYFRPDSWNGGAFDVFRLSANDWHQLKDSNLIAMPAGDPNLDELLKRRNQDQLVVIDFLDYFGIDEIKRHINNIDVVFLSGKKEMLEELKELAFKTGKLIVATLGSKGSIAYYDSKTYSHKAIEVETIVDTTGCGDSFQAAFSIEWLNTRNVDKSLKAGSIAASQVLKFMGGVE